MTIDTKRFMRDAANSAIDHLNTNPTMATNIGHGAGAALGLFGVSRGLKSYDALRNGKYGSAALNAGLSGSSMYLGYMAAFEKGSIQKALGFAERMIK